MKNKAIREGKRKQKKPATKKAVAKRLREPVSKILLEDLFSFDEVINSISDLIAIVDKDAIIHYVSPSIEEITGIPASKLIGQSYFGMIPKDQLSMARKRFAGGFKKQGLIQHSEYRLKHIDGSSHCIATQGKYIKDRRGKEYYVATIQDVTSQRNSEEALRESEEKYRLLAETAHDMIFIIGQDGTVQYVNEFGAKEFDSSPKELIGMKVQDLFPKEHSSRQLANINKVFDTGKPQYVEVTTRFPHGVMYLDSWLVPMRNADGEVASVFGISRDTTARRLAEEESRILAKEAQNERNRAQKYFDFLAHDVANIVSPIVTYSDTILRNHELADPVKEYLQKICIQSELLASFIVNFRMLAESEKIRPDSIEPADLREIIKDAEKSMNSDARMQVGIHIDEEYADRPMNAPGGKYTRHAVLGIFRHMARLLTGTDSASKLAINLGRGKDNGNQNVWMIDMVIPGINLPREMMDALFVSSKIGGRPGPHVPSDESFGAIILNHFGGKLSARHIDKYDSSKGFIARIELPIR